VSAAAALFARAGERLRFVAVSFAPALGIGGLTLAAARTPQSGSLSGTALLSAALVLVALPVMAGFGRGLGLRSLLPGGAAAPRA